MNENADSPSAGVLKFSAKNISRYFNIIMENIDTYYDLPIAGINHVELPKADKEVVVVLGLDRPYQRGGSYNPARCHILVLGLFVV